MKLSTAAAALTVGVATLFVVPAANANAQSPSCAKSIELINIAVETSGGCS
ncbi:hypothetical protein ACFWPK_17955 [Nocardia sp. NPDC058519]|uniref:hypothetical protein n=1 Tax=Nocardia sp. NPDC058519 TaxID=3346535 RepID=UPI0036488086